MPPELRLLLIELATLEDRIRDFQTSADFTTEHHAELLDLFQSTWNEVYKWVNVELR